MNHKSPCGKRRKVESMESLQNNSSQGTDHFSDRDQTAVVSNEDIYHNAYKSNDSLSECLRDVSVRGEKPVSNLEECVEIEELKSWVISNNVPQKHVDALLKILRRRLLPSLPACAKSLLQMIKADSEPTNDFTKEFIGNLDEMLNVDILELDLSHIKCKSEYESAVISNLIQVKNDCNIIKSSQMELKTSVTNMEHKLDAICNFLIDKKVTKSNVEVINFENKYNIKLPIATMEDFLEFDETLKSNHFLRIDVYRELVTCLDKDLGISRSIVRMMKRCLAKNLALQFTAIRTSASKSKSKFKSTELCKVMDAVITDSRRKKSLETTPDELISSLSDVLCNVKRWTV